MGLSALICAPALAPQGWNWIRRHKPLEWGAEGNAHFSRIFKRQTVLLLKCSQVWWDRCWQTLWFPCCWAGSPCHTSSCCSGCWHMEAVEGGGGWPSTFLLRWMNLPLPPGQGSKASFSNPAIELMPCARIRCFTETRTFGCEASWCREVKAQQIETEAPRFQYWILRL